MRWEVIESESLKRAKGPQRREERYMVEMMEGSEVSERDQRPRKQLLIQENTYENLVPEKYYDFEVSAKNSNSWSLSELPKSQSRSRYVKAVERNAKNVDIPSDPESIDEHLEDNEISPEAK
jgi:hypothetical protein